MVYILVSRIIDEARQTVDKNYHMTYSPEREEVQNAIVYEILNISALGQECEIPCNQWMIMTAGPMGGGKSTILQHLMTKEVQELNTLIVIDMDRIRDLLPESEMLKTTDPMDFGTLTQKEAGYISEICVHVALSLHKNIVVDGSLLNLDWHVTYIQSLQQRLPSLITIILHVTSKKNIIRQRVKHRALITGRGIPSKVLREAFKVKTLSHSSNNKDSTKHSKSFNCLRQILAAMLVCRLCSEVLRNRGFDDKYPEQWGHRQSIHQRTGISTVVRN